MEEEQLKSKFSSGINIIIRIDKLWQDTHKHSREGLFSAWNSDLDRIWLELARDLNPSDEEGSEFQKKKKTYNEFDTKIAELGGFNDVITKGFELPSKESITNRNKVYGILMEKQLFLARLENELGKGTTHDEEDDDF
jgi:hypothetical protein